MASSAVRELRIRWIGHTLRAEVDVSVDPDLTVNEAHDLAHHAEAHLLCEVPRLTAATVRVSPWGAHRLRRRAAVTSAFKPGIINRMSSATRGDARIAIAASPQQVYDIVSDVISIGDRSPECYRCEWLDGASVARVGARFKGYNRLGLLRWSTISVVTAAERGREFAFTVLSGDRDSTCWRYVMEGDGQTTTLTESYEFVWCPIVSRIAEAPIPRDKQLRRGIAQTIERVKVEAEARAAASPW